jgi:peroxiredoxin
MKSIQIIAASLLTTAAMAFTIIRPDEHTGLKIGDKAPLSTVEMKGTDDQAYTLEKLVGKKGLIVVFSCNTCPFVVGSENFAGWEVQYNDLYKQASDAGIGFVLVNSNEAKREGDDSMEAMKTRAAEKGYAMPYVVDAQSALANAFGAKTTPHVYFFNENMELIYQGAIDNTVDGKRKEDVPYLQNALRSHVSGKTITENTTPPRGCSIKRVG